MNPAADRAAFLYRLIRRKTFLYAIRPSEAVNSAPRAHNTDMGKTEDIAFKRNREDRETVYPSVGKTAEERE